ncbi:MAG: LptA/OstA family protein [Candidatus Gastranaerophilaceae bacterium]|nr:LptA/OstA family protein [Candidatus Gastranaerophilaceae bacterium]
MKKIILALTIAIFSLGLMVQASDLIIESKSQSFSEDENKIKFNGDVKVSVDDLKVVGDSADVNMDDNQKLDTATFYDKPYAYEIKKNKKREVKANILKVSLITKIVRAEGDTQSVVFDGKTPIVVINADVQEYDTTTNIMTATGNVTMKYKDIDTLSDKAVIKMDKNGDLQTLELIGNGQVKQKGNDSYADRFFYNSATKIITAIGNTTSNMVDNDGKKLTLKSNMQEFLQNKNTFSASGNVRVWYDDYYAVGPKINVYPNKEGKPNDIYFVGRSSITQGVRTIYADKIKMKMKPKDFQAEGNTRTVIKNIGAENGESSGNSGMTLGL